MDFEPLSLGNLLSNYVRAMQPKECEKLMDKLVSQLKEELPENILDVYIINIFNTDSGLLHFIEQTHGLSCSAKLYEKARTAAFKVLYILVNNFPHNVFKYNSSISRTCITVSCSLISGTYEKEQALKIIVLMLEKQVFGGDIDEVKEIYRRLFHYCEVVKNISVTVFGRIMKVFGIITKIFPIVISDSAEKLISYVVNLLYKELNTSKPSKLIVAGCLCMIKDFFVNYEDSNKAELIYRQLKEIILNHDPVDSRKLASRDAIELLQMHSSLFRKQLFEDRNSWHNVLRDYLVLGLEEKKVGSVALESFYKEIAIQLKVNCEKDEILQYLNSFVNTIENSSTKNNFEIRTAIRGLGIFAEVFKINLHSNEILQIFISITRKVEYDYVITEPDYDILSFLPLYIETIGALMGSLNFVTDTQILCFQKILIFMVKTFPKLSQVYHELVVQIFVKTLYQIGDRKNFIAVLVRQGVIWSCSHKYPLNFEETDDDKNQNTNYKNYLPLWKGLLNVFHSKRFQLQSTLEREIAVKFFDEIIITLFYLMNKLNLEIKPKEDCTSYSNPATAYDVVQLSDYEIYLNVVDFYLELSQNFDENLFKKWMQMYINQMIVKSMKQPFNSGFYKLLGVALKISDDLNYFVENKEVENCFELTQTFIKNMLLKMKQFNGDLQIACLNLLLQTPCCLISEILLLTVPAFLTLFSIGKSYFNLVHKSLQTLTRWKNQLPEEKMNAFLEQIIPSLDAYLRSKSLENAKTKPMRKTRKTKQILNKVKILIETEPELLKLQKAILTFLSQLNSKLCYVFVDANGFIELGKPIKYKHLKLDLSYDDSSLTLYLDELLPRIFELALYCSNRKIRMTSCELLHAIVMLLLGTRRKMDIKKQSELDAVFERIVPVLLRLGCDLDEPIQKLFEPLMMSLIRWFTHRLQVRSKPTEILIEALMDGISQSTDPSLRDFSGRCIKELTIWTIKHMDIGRDNETSNIKVLIQRIMSYCLHCDANKKLGAALIFNNIYTVLREEETILNMYWLEILYAFVMCLEITGTNIFEDNCWLEQTNQALDRVKRVLVEKCSKFNRYDPERRLPPHFKGGLLKDVCDFLFKHSASKNPYCRIKCMDLFDSLRPLIEKCDYCESRENCLHIPDGIESFFESNSLEKQEFETFYELFEWLLDFYRALDGYNFIIQNVQITISDRFLFALKYFLNDLAQMNIKKILTKFTYTEKEAFNSLKLKIVLKALDFVLMLLEKNFALGVFWDEFLPKLVCIVVFEPHNLGIELNYINNSHRETIRNLLQIIKNTQTNQLITNIENTITSYIISKQLAPRNFKRNVPLQNRLLIKGIILLKENHLSMKFNLPDIVQQIFAALFEQNDVQIKIVQTFDDTFANYYETMLQLAFFDKIEKKKLIEYFFNNSPVNALNSHKTTTCGKFFFQLFKNIVVPNFLTDFQLFLETAFLQNNPKLIIEYITEFIVYIDNNKSSLQQDTIKNTCELILQNWSKLQIFFDENFKTLQQGFDFIKKLTYIKQAAQLEGDLANWIIESIVRDDFELPFEVIFNFRIQIYELHMCINEEQMRKILHFLQINYYEKQTELTEQSIILSLNKLLDALKSSKSIVILEGFSEIYATTIYNTRQLNVEDALVFYIKQIDLNSQLNSLESIYKVSLEKNTLMGYKLTTTVFEYLLQNCNKTTFENFIKKYISEIVNFIKEEKNTRVIEKIVAYVIIELLFFRIDFLNNETVCNEIVQLTEFNTTQELIKFIATKATLTTKQETNELCRLYQCQAYKALVSVISNTKRDIKQYNLLFVRETTWNCLIDPDKHYTFEPSFENKIPAYKNKFVHIRNEIRAFRKSRGLHTTTIKYTESQSLFTSTLSEDISKFDFTNTTLRTNNKEEQKILPQAVTLETIEINNHECMATICGLIEFIVESDISPLNITPDWIQGISSILSSKTAHKNAKILLTKIIHNTQHIFKVYAKLFLPAIVKLICEGCFGVELNYFIYDLVTMLLEWPKPSEESNNCSELLTFLMKHIDSDVSAIYKMNRELIRTVLEIWRPLLIIPHDYLYEMLKQPSDSKTFSSTIDLIHDIVLNKLEAWNGENLKDFLIELCKVSITNKNKDVYKKAAKAIGLALALLQSKEETKKYVCKLVDLMNKKLDKIVDGDRFLYCLEGLATNYPEIADRYLCRLINDLNTIQGIFKNIILKILSLRCIQLQHVSEFSWLNYEALLLDVDVDVQILTLELIRDCITYYNNTELLRILQIVVKVANNTNITCREIMYEILFKCLQNCVINEEIETLCKYTLIDGFSDQNADIQENVFSYCSSNLSQNLKERTLTLLNDYYKPSKENYYLNNTVCLLFDVFKQSSDYRKVIFDQPLHQCTFEEYKLYGNWRAQHASVVPMFADTLRSQTMQQNSLDSVDLSVIRATQQSLSFEPTQIENESIVVSQEFKDPNKLQLSEKYKMSKYRFLKDKDKVSRQFALWEVKKASNREQARRDLAKQKERGVTFYRQYKKGDFPDIQIETKDVLLPLQILAKHDSEIAKILFNLTLKDLLDKLDNNSAFIEKITEATNKIFSTTIQYNASVMGAFLELSIEHKDTIRLQPDVIATVCQSSGLISTGITIFEEYLLSSCDFTEPAIKRIKTEENIENDYWIYLSELYKQLDEFDAVKGILLEKLNCPELHLQAIQAETDGNWKEALEAYKNLIETDTESQYRKELYYESYFKCFASLSDWGNLSTNIESATENQPWNRFWDQDWYQKKVMPWYLKSELKNTLIRSGNMNKLLISLNECLKDSEKREYLKTNFSEELAILWLLNGDEDEAKIFLRCNVLQFLEKWTCLNRLLCKSRFIKLLHMRNVMDIEVFIKELTNLSPINFEESMVSLKKLFLASVSDEMEIFDVFESRILYEQKFISMTQEKLKSIINFDIELEEMNSDLKKIQYHLNNLLIEAGLKQNNFYVARKYFIQQQKLAVDSDFYLKLLTSKIAFLKAKTFEGERKFQLLMESWGYIEPILSTVSIESELKILTYQHLYDITKQLAHSQLDFETLKAKICDFNITKKEDVALYGLQQLKNTADSLYKNVEQCKLVAEAYINIAYFSQKTQTDLFIVSTLRSMKLGSLKGVQLFPCILNIENLGTTYHELFVIEVQNIPIWMYLRWIPQLLANIDSEKIFAVADIVEKIAMNYPQAIMYAYKLSKDYFLQNANAETLRLIKMLDELLLSDDLVQQFLKALSCVTMPANILRYYLSQKLLKACNYNENQFNSLIDSVIREVYIEIPDSGNVTKFYGNIFKTISHFKTKLEKLKNEKTREKRSSYLKNLIEELRNILDKQKPILNLKDYCPWLANFHSTDFETVLEIPGQYNGLQKPLPQYHVKIAGFKGKVSPMNSLRKPIKITILGNDAKEYSYLVKFGEDLRQDQRIEQLFYLMNDIFKNDYEPSLHHFSIVTYQVIPLTSNLGIIEWVENAEVFTSLIEKQRNKEKKPTASDQMAYESFYKKQTKKFKTPLAMCSRDEILTIYQELASYYPDNLLRCTLCDLSSNLESFVALKNNFIKSYAVMCAAHWILGIGDRHWQNSMLSFKNGEVIGIDFGHAFGTSTQILDFPELVPFRLTPYIVNVLEPLGTNGFFKETIIKTLKAFRRNSDALLSTMEVFVKEPSLDWKQYATAFETIHSFSKVHQAKRKLEGINPVECMIEDLMANVKVKSVVDDYIKIVKGEPQYDVRARKGGNLLSVEEQVECLIDLATDRNTLGRMYRGYMAWV